MIRWLPIAAAALVLAGSSAATDGGNHLVLTGALKTSSARGVTPNETGCGVQRGRLLFGSGAMLLGRGPAVARVSFELRFRGRGVYSALSPRVAYGRTPLQVVTGRNATIGTGNGWLLARQGHVSVTNAAFSGSRLRSASGRIRADLATQGRVVHLRGAWRCATVSY